MPWLLAQGTGKIRLKGGIRTGVTGEGCCCNDCTASDCPDCGDTITATITWAPNANCPDGYMGTWILTRIEGTCVWTSDPDGDTIIAIGKNNDCSWSISGDGNIPCLTRPPEVFGGNFPSPPSPCPPSTGWDTSPQDITIELVTTP
jgi:hypothetical protein